MKLEVLEKSENTLAFVVSDVDKYFMNALRRLIIEEVPTMAIADVEFRKNSSTLYDQMIAHRLGLIPLTTDLKSYNLPSECKCEGAGCARCQVKLKLSDSKPGTVYSSKLKSADPKVAPAFDQIPIVKLLEGQQLQFEATATLGKGKDHSKWTPGLLVYYQVPLIEVKNPQKIKEVLQKYDFLELKGSKVVLKKDIFVEHNKIEAVLEQFPEGSYSIAHEENEFIVYLESFGQLKCKEILSRAMDELDIQLDDFAEKIKGLKE